MPHDLSIQLRQAVEEALPRLRAIGEATASTPPERGAWSPKQELGHLIDSSTNNEVRFVRAAIEGRFNGPSYDQNAWVDLHGYGDWPWTILVKMWSARNDLLARLIERIPDTALGLECVIGDGPAVTLGFVVEDYIRHLRHHLDHIAPV